MLKNTLKKDTVPVTTLIVELIDTLPVCQVELSVRAKSTLAQPILWLRVVARLIDKAVGTNSDVHTKLLAPEFELLSVLDLLEVATPGLGVGKGQLLATSGVELPWLGAFGE